MKLVAKLTFKYIKENKLRTLLTIFGLAISISMIVFVLETIVSLNDTYLKSSIKDNGYHDFMISKADHELYHNVVTSRNVSKLVRTKEDKRILFYYDRLNGAEAIANVSLKDVEEDYFKYFFKHDMVLGRLPEKDGEAIVPYDIKDSLPELSKMDKSFEVSSLDNGTYESFSRDFSFLSEDTSENYQKSLNNIRIEGLFDYIKNRYTKETSDFSKEQMVIVGYYNGTSYSRGLVNKNRNLLRKGISESDYFESEIIRYSSDFDGKSNLYGLFSRYDITDETSNHIKSIVNDSNSKKELSELDKSSFIVNSKLLGLKYPFRGRGSALFFIGGFFFIGLILLYVSIFLNNIFSTNFAEKTDALGLLKVVGLTNAQLRQMIYLDAFFYFIVSLPLGFLLAKLGARIVFKYINNLFNSSITGFYLFMSYKQSSKVFLLTAIIAFILIFLLEYMASRFVLKSYPIESMNHGILEAFPGKSKWKYPIMRRLFGYEAFLALRNSRRNKKRFAITALSITVSIIILVFTIFITKFLDIQVSKTLKRSENSYGIITSGNNLKTQNFINDINGLKGLKAINDYSYMGIGVKTKDEIYSENSTVLVMMDDEIYDKRVQDMVDGLASHEEYALVLNDNKSINNNGEELSFVLNKEDFSKKFRTVIINKEVPRIMKYLKETEEYDNVILLKRSYLSQIHKKGSIQFTDIVELERTFDNPDLFEGLKSVIVKYPTMFIEGFDPPILSVFKLYSITFVTIITLIAILNVLNTTYNNIMTRRREIALVRAVGLEENRMKKLIILESVTPVVVASLLSLLVLIPLISLFYTVQSREMGGKTLTILYPIGLYFLSIFTSFVIVYLTSNIQYRSIRKYNLTMELKS